MRDNYSLFRHNRPLDSGQLARARELLELKTRVQQLFNTLENVYDDRCRTVITANKVAPKSLFSTRSAAETFEYPTRFTAPTRIW